MLSKGSEHWYTLTLAGFMALEATRGPADTGGGESARRRDGGSPCYTITDAGRVALASENDTEAVI